ncbi:MAG: ABC transporter permease, partial [Bacteroidota bacterium]
MFDLEKSIKQWLKQFRKHRAFDAASLHEMELHLKDHIDDLIKEGHSERSAFDTAVEEFGEVPNMADEEFLNQRPQNITSRLGLTMYSNYLKVALRSFTKQPFFTFLNTFGLAVGMAGGLLISLFIYNELNYDKANVFADAERIYRVHIDNKTAGEVTKHAAVSGPLADVIRQDYPHQTLVTRFREVASVLLKKRDDDLNTKEDKVTAVDSTFFEMFEIQLLEGDLNTALKQPKSLVLTQKAAEDYFGTIEALGKSLLVDDGDEYLVTGVVEDMPKNSFLRDYRIFMSLSSYENSKSLAWNNWSFPTFVKLRKEASPQHLKDYLGTVTERYLIPWAMTFVPGLTVESARAANQETGNYLNFGAMPLTDIHLHSRDRESEFNINSDIQNVYILSAIGFFLILLASVNFMNLSTAYSLKRAKEVGVRKTLGSSRVGLIRQFLTEAGVISFLSLGLAIVIVLIALPYFNELSGKQIKVPFQNPIFWIVLALSTITLAFLSGSYPAFMLSRFKSAEVLKSSQNRGGGSRVRNVLVVFQFAISVFLIVGTLVVYQQLSFIQNKDLGYKKDQILIVDNINAAGSQREALKQEVQKIGNVSSVSLSSFLPTPSARNGTTFFQEGILESMDAVIIGNWRIDYDYVTTLNLELIEGRNFNRAFATDSSALIINESALPMFGVSAEEAIGMRVTNDFHRPDKENMKFYTVIGVVKNFHFESLRNNINGLSFRLGQDAKRMMVKLEVGEFSQPIAEIEEVWKKICPGQPFNYYFMDESFNDTYKADAQLGRIFIIFTTLSILIACLGLFGLTAFNAERRAKEIGIRKVLGAQVSQITLKLSLNFLKLVSLAIIISLPLSWYVMNKWLEDFSYRINISWWVFVLSAALAITISIVTVCYQSIKAAIVNPVKSLRTE